MLIRSTSIALFAIFLPLITACSCPNLTFEEKYESANVVVKARVVFKKRFAPRPPFFAVSYLFKLQVLRTFKNCSPGEFFYAKTMLDGGTCSSVLEKGAVYKIQLPTNPETSDKFPRLFYNFYGCDDAFAWKYVTPQQRHFLRTQSTKPENRCTT